ncbi:hypothetical protein SSX86_021209 [Deinandra increscens subsp. villosa]|uniref:Uncharacterized protein n=1 Tax=Deinandra increscens subsp. villosa TaxID=3103831 RepID=A0AAP0CPA4_9ASTR
MDATNEISNILNATKITKGKGTSTNVYKKTYKPRPTRVQRKVEKDDAENEQKKTFDESKEKTNDQAIRNIVGNVLEAINQDHNMHVDEETTLVDMNENHVNDDEDVNPPNDKVKKQGKQGMMKALAAMVEPSRDKQIADTSKNQRKVSMGATKKRTSEVHDKTGCRDTIHDDITEGREDSDGITKKPKKYHTRSTKVQKKTVTEDATVKRRADKKNRRECGDESEEVVDMELLDLTDSEGGASGGTSKPVKKKQGLKRSHHKNPKQAPKLAREGGVENYCGEKRDTLMKDSVTDDNEV